MPMYTVTHTHTHIHVHVHVHSKHTCILNEYTVISTGINFL